MLGLIIVILLVIIFCFAGVLFFGAPYLPTLDPQIDAALRLANLDKGQVLLELGCGDGKVLIAAADRGLTVVGYELNPILAIISWLRTRRYKGRVKVIWGDFWTSKWPEADAIFVFLLDKYMDKLDKKCVQYSFKPITLVSFAFQIKNRQPDEVDKGVFLYRYK